MFEISCSRTASLNQKYRNAERCCVCVHLIRLLATVGHFLDGHHLIGADVMGL